MFAIVPRRVRSYFYGCKANPFCREAEMIDLKKKCWREKVTSEITVAHVLQFAREMGTGMSAAEAAAFLNEGGRAQAVWMHMMQAGEAFLKSNLAGSTGLHNVGRSVAPAAPPPNPLHRKAMRGPQPPSAFYQ
jgi:hypothetical protein